MSPAMWAYAEVDALWARFQPETPYGRAAKVRRVPITDRAALERLYDLTDHARALLEDLESDPIRRDRLTHHLKRLPRFPETPQSLYDEVEIFQFKKFLFNHRCLLDRLTEGLRQAFGLAYLDPSLEGRLNQGRQSEESFYIADAYLPELAETRRSLRAVDTGLQALRAQAEAHCMARWGFTFEGRAFVLLPRTRLGDPEAARALLEVEPYDETQVCLRPRATTEELRLAGHREELLARERALETEVLAQLSAPLREALPALQQQAQAIEAFDLALAGARLALEANLVRPGLASASIVIEGGRHLPCEALCGELGTPYTPLEAIFDQGATVLFGSNMGGKTVVLKTLAFLQLAAQMGLYVPARRFKTRVFRHFHYMGEGRSREEARGLSGFGFEIRQFTEAWGDLEQDTLLLFDEFARTTSSQEAEALVSAILEDLAARPSVVAAFSTHFRGIRRLPGVRYLRMGGLDRARLAALEAPGTTLAERIRQIDHAMRFSLEPDAAGDTRSDALVVAERLGLPATLARRAAAFLNETN